MTEDKARDRWNDWPIVALRAQRDDAGYLREVHFTCRGRHVQAYVDPPWSASAERLGGAEGATWLVRVNRERVPHVLQARRDDDAETIAERIVALGVCD